MADHLGWRWEFGIQVPFICVCLAIAVLFIPTDLGLYDNKRETVLEVMRVFDFAGSGLMSLSLIFLILGLVSRHISHILGELNTDTPV